ncbi:MAG: CDP-diacylglycerol--serine O-phosphatidyltransferase [SAR86 cluster bacterium]|nr:CDP-diacylglycerol--serine O-phosphatidyltransferase [SAR86 cluster bacterium]
MSKETKDSIPPLYDEHEEIVSEAGKRVKRKGIFLLPNLFTTASLFSGFFAIIASIESNFILAGMAIFAAQIFDGLDGRVARLTNAESPFGAQYDSLCDVISFGIAPAIMVFLWGLEELGRVGWVISFLYLAATALRLARFNVEIELTDSKFFSGLPSPVAAAFIVYFVWTLSASGIQQETVSFSLAILTASLTGLVTMLMVVNVPYYSFKDINLRNRVPFFAILFAVFIIALISIDPPIVLVVCASTYVISGPIIYLLKAIRN